MSARYSKIDREPIRTIVIRLLALGELKQGEIGERYDVDQSTVSVFAKRHAVRIAEVRGKLDDEFVGLVYAQKVNRLAVLSQQVDDIADILGSDVVQDGDKRRGLTGVNVSTAELMRTQAQALRAIADELGQIPARLQVAHTGSLSVQINGVDMDDLR